MAHVGLNVIEGVSSGMSAFNEASINNIGVMMERERGVPDLVTMVTSLQEDRVRFGGIQAAHYGAYVTRHIFNNARSFGATLYGLRIYAGTTLSDTARGHFANTSAVPTFAHHLDTAAGVSQGQIDHFTPSNVHDKDIFKVYCNEEVVSFTAATTAAVDVVTGLKAAITAKAIASPTGEWANVAPTGTTYLITTTADNTPAAFMVECYAAGTIMHLYAGQEGQKDPGTWANTDGTDTGLIVKVYPKDHPNGILGAYLLEVYMNGTLVEVFQGTTWVDLIDKINMSSLFIMAVPEDTTLDITGATVSDIQTITFAQGVYTEFDDAAAQVTAMTPSYAIDGAAQGAALFDGVDIQLLIQTEVVTEDNSELTTLAGSLATYCEGRSDLYHPFSLPLNSNDTLIGEIATALQASTPSFIGGYHMWMKTSNENGLFVWVPGIGGIIGADYIYTREANGGFVWIPPAGTDSALKDCTDITPNPLSREKVDLYVRGRSTNVVQFQKGYGFISMSSRTYSSNILYHSAHVRLMTNWLVKTLNNNLLWTIQKPNSPVLRKDIVTSITAFFKNVYNNGGLESTIPFNEACRVICDKTNNPMSQDRKILNVTIEWIPVECTETVVIRLNRNDGMLIVKSLES